ncbi:hypothetical protein [Aliikangiella sp. IMCC44632]
MQEKLKVELSAEATAKYLDWVKKRTRAEVAADCEPSGATISIDICPPYFNLVYAMQGEEKIEFGEADVELVIS